MAGPADHTRYAKGTLSAGVLLVAEGSHGGIGPSVHVRSVVGSVEHDGIFCDSQLVKGLKNGAHVLVVIDHRIVIEALVYGPA